MANEYTCISVTKIFKSKVRQVAALQGKKMYQVCDELAPLLDKQLKKNPTKGTQQHAGRSES